jgi:hypothetical protein
MKCPHCNSTNIRKDDIHYYTYCDECNSVLIIATIENILQPTGFIYAPYIPVFFTNNGMKIWGQKTLKAKANEVSYM